jgi:hypothetical protein
MSTRSPRSPRAPRKPVVRKPISGVPVIRKPKPPDLSHVPTAAAIQKKVADRLTGLPPRPGKGKPTRSARGRAGAGRAERLKARAARRAGRGSRRGSRGRSD